MTVVTSLSFYVFTVSTKCGDSNDIKGKQFCLRSQPVSGWRLEVGKGREGGCE